MHFLLGELPFHRNVCFSSVCTRINNNYANIIMTIKMWSFSKTSKMYYTLHLSDKGILYNTDFSDNTELPIKEMVIRSHLSSF